MTFEAIVEADFVTLRLVGHYVPAETEPHGEYVDEHFEDMEVWLVGDHFEAMGNLGRETDITSSIKQKQYEALEAVLMQEWKNR